MRLRFNRRRALDLGFPFAVGLVSGSLFGFWWSLLILPVVLIPAALYAESKCW